MALPRWSCSADCKVLRAVPLSRRCSRLSSFFLRHACRGSRRRSPASWPFLRRQLGPSSEVGSRKPIPGTGYFLSPLLQNSLLPFSRPPSFPSTHPPPPPYSTSPPFPPFSSL